MVFILKVSILIMQIVPLYAPQMMCLPSGVMAMAYTVPLISSITFISSPFFISHMRTVLSDEPLTIYSPFGVTAIAVTAMVTALGA